ncbi:MAG: alkaline phosphatase family protein [Phycisphaeraceae bacterium]
MPRRVSMKWSLLIACILAALCPALLMQAQDAAPPAATPPAATPTPAATPAPAPAAPALPAPPAPNLADPAGRRILIISVDGLRPDLMLRGDTPRMRSLLDQASFTCWAQTTQVSITLPSHVSMLTGVEPKKHAITWNDDRELPPDTWPQYPTIFELAKQAGYSTAMIAGKLKFKVLLKPGTLDWSYVPTTGKATDTAVGDEAVRVLREHQPQVMFVHFAEPDGAGHKYGWSSPEQMKTIAGADVQIGRLLDTLSDLKLRDATWIIVTADHGGAGKGHGANDPRSLHIPWIITGPGIKAGQDLTIHKELVVHTEDTFATACWLLTIPQPADIQGRPVVQVAATTP